MRLSVQPVNFQPVCFMLDPENHDLSKLVVFPEPFPSIPNYLVNMLYRRALWGHVLQWTAAMFRHVFLWSTSLPVRCVRASHV